MISLLFLTTIALLIPPQVVGGAAVSSPVHLGKRQNPDPVAIGNRTDGYQNIPEPVDATLHTDWKIGDPGVNFPLLLSNDNPDLTAVKHAVIVVPGKRRDCWYYWNKIHNALILASEKDLGVKVEEVSIASPCYMAEIDRTAGAVDDDTLIFGLTTWASGHFSVAPAFAGRISAYQVLDEIVEFFMDTSTFPSLNTVVVAGHSLGGQMVQRYPAMRKTAGTDSRLHYWVANPGSLLWLVEDRPLPEFEVDCDGFDNFKYGLAGNFPGHAFGDANDLGREGLVERYRSRNIHYALGLADRGNGDIRCQAQTQGTTHIMRGQNFDDMLHAMEDGMPAAQTIDYVEGVSHNDTGMINSDQGIDKLFVLNYNATTPMSD